jgi:hypothetical protein
MGAETEPANVEDAICIDNGALMLPSGCTMPPLCILTNRPVSEKDMIEANLYWCPRSVSFVSLLLSGGLLLIAYFLAREQFTIIYGLDPAITRRKAFWTGIKVFGAIASLAATVVLACSPYVSRLITGLVAAAFVSFLACVAALFFGNSPLRVVDHRNGMFWVKGFSKAYLAALTLEA